ncbi:MAG: DUF2164 domain-containing protein [Chloroflexi bacterium CFX7]|nr:DUF2164 domain-containing protein [Chloroflexi bacterium CFX7]MCK6563587.1 DUF2164 domain-containing protein [Dehalococcoidia bacterium]RIL03007.1 MAG: DUF2164 domain-containing protein [bacterium]
MSIRLPKAEKADYVRRLQEYVQAELDLEIGELGAEFLFDFVAGLAGPVYYNEALEDARAVASNRADSIQEEILALRREPPRER